MHAIADAEDTYVPVLQRAHTEALDSDENVPAAHWVHCVDAVVVALEPGVHVAQMLRPAVEA